MSDDNKATDVVEKKAEADSQKQSQETSNAADAEKKELIAQRDKLKAKLREIEEKDKKAAEAKAIEEGKIKDVLASRESELAELRKKVEAVEAANQAQRAKALERVPDEMRKFAVNMSDAAEILEFADKIAEKKLTTHTDKSKATTAEPQKFKSGHEWQRAMLDRGVGT